MTDWVSNPTGKNQTKNQNQDGNPFGEEAACCLAPLLRFHVVLLAIGFLNSDVLISQTQLGQDSACKKQFQALC